MSPLGLTTTDRATLVCEVAALRQVRHRSERGGARRPGLHAVLEPTVDRLYQRIDGHRASLHQTQQLLAALKTMSAVIRDHCSSERRLERGAVARRQHSERGDLDAIERAKICVERSIRMEHGGRTAPQDKIPRQQHTLGRQVAHGVTRVPRSGEDLDAATIDESAGATIVMQLGRLDKRGVQHARCLLGERSVIGMPVGRHDDPNRRLEISHGARKLLQMSRGLRTRVHQAPAIHSCHEIRVRAVQGHRGGVVCQHPPDTICQLGPTQGKVRHKRTRILQRTASSVLCSIQPIETTPGVKA
jgi:hypothetical protein